MKPLQYLVRSWPIIVELISVWKRLREFEAKLEINRSIEIANSDNRKKFEDLILNVSSRAALSAKYLVGKKDKTAADKAAVDAMRSQLNKIDMNGEIVIGEVSLMKHLCYLLVKKLVLLMDHF